MTKYEIETVKAVEQMLNEVFGCKFNFPESKPLTKDTMSFSDLDWIDRPKCNNSPCTCGDGDEQGYDYF